MLEKKNRLKARKDFRRTYKRGRALPMPAFVLYHCKNYLSNYRVGFSVSKKNGNAVERNRIKRKLRAACKEKEHLFKPGYDYILIARFGSKKASVDNLGLQIEKVFKKLAKK